MLRLLEGFHDMVELVGDNLIHYGTDELSDCQSLMISYSEREVAEYVGVDLFVLGPEEHLLFVQGTDTLQKVRPDDPKLRVVGKLLYVIDVGLAEVQAVEDEVGLLVVLKLIYSDG